MVWKLIRQDTHGSRFDVASFESEEEALDAMASYESGYPHHQTYYVEHRTGVRPGDPLAFDYPIESLQDVLVVLTHLRTNLESDPDSWENSTLPGFLEAMAAWLSTFPQAYVNLDESVPEADWKLLADCLRAARIYE